MNIYYISNGLYVRHYVKGEHEENSHDLHDEMLCDGGLDLEGIRYYSDGGRKVVPVLGSR